MGAFAFLTLLCTPAILGAETCGKDAEGGALQSDAKASGHSLQWTKALISKPAPYFEGTAVVKGQMKELKVTDYRGKYLVFFFYPLAFTFVCPTEILAFNDRIAEFRALNAEVVACSVDSHFTQLAWTNSQERREDWVLWTFHFWLISLTRSPRTMVSIWRIMAIVSEVYSSLMIKVS